MSRSQDLSPRFAGWGRKKTVLGCPLPLLLEPKQQEGEARNKGKEMVFISEQNHNVLRLAPAVRCGHCTFKTESPFHDRRHTNHSASARENSHMQPITEKRMSFSLRRVKIIRHGFFDAKKSGPRMKTNSFKYLQHNAHMYLWKCSKSALKCGLTFQAALFFYLSNSLTCVLFSYISL